MRFTRYSSSILDTLSELGLRPRRRLTVLVYVDDFDEIHEIHGSPHSGSWVTIYWELEREGEAWEGPGTAERMRIW